MTLVKFDEFLWLFSVANPDMECVRRIRAVRSPPTEIHPEIRQRTEVRIMLHTAIIERFLHGRSER